MASSPLVSVIVPLRNSGKHINTLLASLTSQDYPNYEIILVGGVQDDTWQAINSEYLNWGGLFLEGVVTEYDPKQLYSSAVRIQAVHGNHLSIVEVTLPETWEGRDSNVKRNVGARLARGNVLFYTDAKIQHETNWITYGLEIMREKQVEAVAGIMLATEESADTFLGMYADSALIKRNPEFGNGYYLDRENFGDGESLPITACWAMTKDAYMVMHGFDETFTISYEDYSGAWRYCAHEGVFFCSGEWIVTHKHRTEFQGMTLEFQRSARGAAQLTYTYPDCPFGRRRVIQVSGVMTGLIVGLTTLLYLILFGPVEILVLGMLVGLVGYLTLAFANAKKAKHWYGLFFPILMIFFIIVFSWNFTHQFFVRGRGGKFLQTMWSLVVRTMS